MTRIVRCRGFGEKENRGMNRDAMIMVRSGLLDRIDAIAAQSGSLKLAQLCEQVDAIRQIARVHNLRPVEPFARTLESASSEERRVGKEWVSPCRSRGGAGN